MVEAKRQLNDIFKVLEKNKKTANLELFTQWKYLSEVKVK